MVLKGQRDGDKEGLEAEMNSKSKVARERLTLHDDVLLYGRNDGENLPGTPGNRLWAESAVWWSVVSSDVGNVSHMLSEIYPSRGTND